MNYPIIAKIFRDCFRIDAPVTMRIPVLTVAGDNSRSLLHNGKFYSPLVDTIEDDLSPRGVACLSVARIISTIRGERSYGNIYAPDGGFARALLQKRLKGLFVRGRYPYSRMEEAVWGRILDATGARKVVGIQPSRELCVAGHRRGVWVADIQHGVIADMHAWYGESFRGHEPIEYLPHAFLCWDQGSACVIRKWSEKRRVSAQVIGNHWLARFRDPSPEDRLVQELLGEYQRRLPPLDRVRTILVSLSWGHDDIPNGVMPEALVRVIRRTSGEYRWLIRLHPNQVRGFARHEGRLFTKVYRESLENHADWEAATFAALPAVLKSVDLHISWTSSVAIEAAHMGVKSALLNPRLRSEGPVGEYYGYYRDMGMVDLFEATDATLLAWIERNIDMKQPPVALGDSATAYRSLIDFLSQ